MKKISEAIERYEERQPDLKWLPFVNVTATNLKIDKGNKVVTADVTVQTEHKNETTYGCKYCFDVLSIKEEVCSMKKLFSIGNLKLGKDTMIFNMSPAQDCQSSRMGLCKVGKACYALKAEKCYPNVLPFRQRQAAFWTSCTVDEFVEAVSQQKTKGIKYLRVNESGDFRNQADVDRLNEIAKAIKEKYNISTYLYTARTDLTFKDTHFIVNGSSWMADNEFRYIPKGATPGSDVQAICPGDCRTCNLCKQKGGVVIGVEHH